MSCACSIAAQRSDSDQVSGTLKKSAYTDQCAGRYIPLCGLSSCVRVVDRVVGTYYRIVVPSDSVEESASNYSSTVLHVPAVLTPCKHPIGSFPFSSFTSVSVSFYFLVSSYSIVQNIAACCDSQVR